MNNSPRCMIVILPKSQLLYSSLFKKFLWPYLWKQCRKPSAFKGKSRKRLSNGALNVPGFDAVHPHCFFRPTSICQMSHYCPHQFSSIYTYIFLHQCHSYLSLCQNIHPKCLSLNMHISCRSHPLKREISSHPLSKWIEKEQPYLVAAFRLFWWLVF